MKYFSIIITVMVAALIGRNTEPQTNWFFDQSTQQGFYIFEDITIDGEVVVGDGGDSSSPCYTSGDCDVIGAFRRGVCSNPDGQGLGEVYCTAVLNATWSTDEEICIGWVYANSEGGTTVPLMGKEGDPGDAKFTYANTGDVAYLKVYDSSIGSILDLVPSAELPGWVPLMIETIVGTSTACNGGDELDDCGICSGSFGGHEANSDKDCLGECFGDAEYDCLGVCDGDGELDDCGVCDGPGYPGWECNDGAASCWDIAEGACDCDGNVPDECGDCGGNNYECENSANACVCAGCTNSDADNHDDSATIDDGTCEYTVPGVDDLAAQPGPNRVFLTWAQPEDTFVNNNGSYTYDVYMDDTLRFNSLTAGTTVYNLTAGQPYSFFVIAVHEYGSSGASNIIVETPTEPTGAPTWRLQLAAEIDSYDEFENNGNPEWLLRDDQNFLGTASDGSWGYDEDHDIPEPPPGPSNYISLFFDHPEWELDDWAAHFTEDIVSDNEDFFKTNLTQWNGTVVSNVTGSASITFSIDRCCNIGPVPGTYEIYVELDGVFTSITNDDSTQTKVEFYMDGSGQKDFSVFIGNIVPQAPDGLEATPHKSSITLDWVGDDPSDLSDIGNRYPAINYNVYRDDQPADPDGNQCLDADNNDVCDSSTAYGPGDGAGGCGGLLTGAGYGGQAALTYIDGADIYDAYPGEGLLQESTYFYTVTGSNLAGESSYGHTVRMSGGAETFHDGRDSRVSAETGANDSPYVKLSNTESSDDDYLPDTGLNESGFYRIPHNFDPDANVISISDDGSASGDDDYPLYIDNYLWTLVSSDNGDSGMAVLGAITGTDSEEVSFTVSNPHENGQASYTWQLYVDTSHPVKIDDGNAEELLDPLNYNTCGSWQSEMHLHSHTDSISVTIDEEPNADPVASSALGLIRGADGISVVTSDQYDVSDFNDYDGNPGNPDEDNPIEPSGDQVWYEPHDNDGAANPADLYFSASNSDDADGECTSGGFGDNQTCDHQTYSWSLTTGALAGFLYEDLNGNGQYDEGEPFTLAGGDEIYESADLGDFIAGGPAAVPFGGTCGACVGDTYIASAPVAEDGSYDYNGRDLHFQREDDVYILSMTVTDVYGDMDGTSLVISVSDERNEGPTVGDLREQETYYISYGKNTRQTQVGDENCAADDLNAADLDNDDLDFSWDYAYNDAGTDGSALVYGDGDDDSEYTHVQDGGPALNDNGWKDIGYDLEEGDHTFTFTAIDSYGADASSFTTIKVRREPDAVPATVGVVYEDLKYVTVQVSDNNLDAFDADECYGDVYDGDLDNTRTIELSNDGNIIETFRQTDDGSWVADEPTAGESTFIQIDKHLEAETTYTYSVQSYNDDGELGGFGTESSADATTGNRPTVEVNTPNGLEIASITDLYDVEFTTTDSQYISRIEVFYLRDGETEEDGTDQAGAKVESNTGVNSAGVASGDDATNSFEISDDTGLEVNYNAKVRVEVHDVGNYDGGNSQSKSDDSDDPFTMAAHTLHNDYGAGWHLFGPALDIYTSELDLVEHLQGPSNMGNWGQDWVAYNVGGQYDNLSLNLGEGYYLAVADGATMEVRGNPVIGDPIESGDGGDLSLDKGWNLVANPLVNKIAKSELIICEQDSTGVCPGDDLLFEDAVDAGWIAPTIYGWFENSYTPIDRLMPFGGYWVNTSRDLTIKVRPHLFEGGELTRKVENMAGKLEINARDISGDGSSDFVTIGIDEYANNEFSYGEDEYDLPRQAYASMGGEYIDLKIGTDLMKDIRSAEYEVFQAWNLTLENEKVDNDIELSWGDLIAFEDDIHLVINGEAIDMHQESAIEISSNINEFAVVVGNIDSYLNPIPDAFGLGAAYPNPFNPVTKLDLALNVEGHVNMSVFNIRGQVVEVLVDRNMKAGYHNITWNADGISSGMYFVRVEKGANTAMQKVMLLK